MLKFAKNIGMFLLMVGLVTGGGLSLVEHAQAANTIGSGQQTNTTLGGGQQQNNTIGGGQNNTPVSISSGQTTLKNPLGNTTITGFFLSLVDALLVFAIPFIVFFIIYAGFLYVTARGNASKVQQAHKALLYALIGGVIILGAHAILSIVSGTVAQFTS